MKYAITNQDRTLFLTMQDCVIQWTPNINLAYVFSTEQEAAEYEEHPQVDNFLSDSGVYNYINDIAGLLEIENARVKKFLLKEYGFNLSQSNL